MAKGFADPVVSITDDKVDVVIHASSITDPQRAQIEDIVKRKAEVGADQTLSRCLIWQIKVLWPCKKFLYISGRFCYNKG